MALIMFYGTECVHCHEMMPLIEKVEKELGVKIKKLETWHNSTNEAKRKKADDGICGGVPFFVNEESGKTICGSVSYAVFKKWAQGK